ncbi:cysteine-rich repeat secretory protein 56 isoform X2 [Carica papaya]|uniref:cysteine-rich repeat secretory protein 56 isoform X2 n=1 Tax=Carica papaya TaxID=3649 RepID=UPI000B8C8FE9|nr:cysteine-rich repeat secretory protein 56 isoform X2 [Carica papaya]
MGFPKESFFFLLLLISVSVMIHLTIFFGFLTVAATAVDYTNLVFKGCADQNFQDSSGLYSQNLKTLLSSMVSQSSQKIFWTTTSGDDRTAIRGLYQCRGDLTTGQCSTCIGKIPELINKLCGKAVAARVQLSGCYLRYEVAGFKQVAETELLYKVCGSIQASGGGFEERRKMAFDTAVNGVKNNGGGLFYTGVYQSVYVLGQCEGDLASSDCGDCLKSGFEKVESECGESISGQAYLHKCYVSYSYYPNGVPTINPSSGSSKQHTQRTVAIAVGGVAAFGFLVVCLLFAKSVLKKRVDY